MADARRVRRLVAWRTERGWTQAELAAAAGVSEATIIRTEGRQRSPRVTTRKRIAAALGLAIGQVAEFAVDDGDGTADRGTDAQA